MSGAVLTRAERIARLNDLARRAMGIACVVVATEGIRALPEADQSRLRELVETFDAFTPVMTVLNWIPELEVEAIVSSCCGMAGSFGYEAEHIEASRQMAELSLLTGNRTVKGLIGSEEAVGRSLGLPAPGQSP